MPSPSDADAAIQAPELDTTLKRIADALERLAPAPPP